MELLPYFSTLGVDEPPAITWLMLRSSGWPMPEQRGKLKDAAATLRATGLFDEDYYVAQLGPMAIGLDPAIHYLAIGEQMGMPPSSTFDPNYYFARHPDVAQSGMNGLMHFGLHGRAEGRTASPAEIASVGRATFDPNKANVILVVHEASRTGAPILGWNIALHLKRLYNLFTICLGDGDLTEDFAALSVELYGPFLGSRRDEVDVEYSLRNFLDARPYQYAIVNSAESRLVVEPCMRRFIPTVFVIHEFASYVDPVASLRSALDFSTAIVFPAPVVARSSEKAHPNLRARITHVMPQGVVALPTRDGEPQEQNGERSILCQLAAKHDQGEIFLVLGAGSVHLRKGVDLFLATAAAVLRRQPGRVTHFLWLGAGYHPLDDHHYSAYLQEQLERSGLTEHVTILEPVADLESIYRIADVFFLSSRLDPLPNVTIDAAVRGIPVICFKGASGMADLMLESSATALGVVEHLDVEAASRVIVDLANDNNLRDRLAKAMVALARANFDMEGYVARLDSIGKAAACQMEQRRADAEILRADTTFDQDMFLGPCDTVETRELTIARYLAIGSARGWDTPLEQDNLLRRPSPGFNPRIYADAHERGLIGAIDPLADFVRRGKPAGPWQIEVLRPDDASGPATSADRLRLALHAHFFYSELCLDFLAHLGVNQRDCDLFVSTDSPKKAEQLRRVLGAYSKGRVEIRIMPNKGRNFGPLLTGFADELNDYDLIGHVHSKRSLSSAQHSSHYNWGDGWREFLWQNVIGGLHPMLDKIAAAFGREDSVGLIFPSDPHLVGWNDNCVRAREIALRMGWRGDLPNHFDFPLGSMFWMRREALRPLLDLRLNWNDYAEEPLPYDGTLVHALERLPTIACRLAGFNYAVTHVPGVSWMPAAT
jgi:glycosyltransferase involved in cell wall biosynthesis